MSVHPVLWYGVKGLDIEIDNEVKMVGSTGIERATLTVSNRGALF